MRVQVAFIDPALACLNNNEKAGVMRTILHLCTLGIVILAAQGAAANTPTIRKGLRNDLGKKMTP